MPSWSYDGERGPDEWADLDEDFALCESGMKQSPIDLAHAKVKIGDSLAALQTNWEESDVVSLWNNGHTWQVNLQAGSAFIVPGANDPYHLKQLHFHAPSEHSVDGKTYPMEVHFVHVPTDPQTDSTYAVIGVFFEEGAANPDLEALWAKFSVCPQEEPEQQPGVALDPTALLPDDGDYFSYDGSLTTPACLEGVHWHVLSSPITASRAQIEKFQEIFGGNARPLQDLDEREIVKFED